MFIEAHQYPVALGWRQLVLQAVLHPTITTAPLLFYSQTVHHRYRTVALPPKVVHFLVPMPQLWRMPLERHCASLTSKAVLWRRGTVLTLSKPIQASLWAGNWLRKGGIYGVSNHQGESKSKLWATLEKQHRNIDIVLNTYAAISNNSIFHSFYGSLCCFWVLWPKLQPFVILSICHISCNIHFFCHWYSLLFWRRSSYIFFAASYLYHEVEPQFVSAILPSPYNSPILPPPSSQLIIQLPSCALNSLFFLCKPTPFRSLRSFTHFCFQNPVCIRVLHAHAILPPFGPVCATCTPTHVLSWWSFCVGNLGTRIPSFTWCRIPLCAGISCRQLALVVLTPKHNAIIKHWTFSSHVDLNFWARNCSWKDGCSSSALILKGDAMIKCCGFSNHDGMGRGANLIMVKESDGENLVFDHG